MRILLLSAYHANSHAYWQQGLMATFPDYQWTSLNLPPRYFNWRVRGNPLSWLSRELSTLTAGFDLVLATSMVDVATLRGLVPALANTPWLVYFHENQFAYPPSPEQPERERRLEPQMVNLYAALAADQLCFNSAYNLESFLAGCESLCRDLPDWVPESGWFDRLRAKSRVLPVPLNPESLARERRRSRPAQPLRIVWNHRWEYDKGTELLLHAVTAMETAGLAVELSLLGQRFRRVPETMSQLLERPGSRVAVRDLGFVADRQDYLAALAGQDIVLSTSLHDFQGLSVMEAVQAGCVPLLPRRLCYPEFFYEACLYDSCPDDPARESAALASRLVSWVDQGLPSVPDLSPLTWPAQRAAYQSALVETAGNNFHREPVS